MRPINRTFVAALAFLVACGQLGGGDGDSEAGGAEIIRFAFAPDPVWDYLTDTATLAQWEEDNNLRIVTSATWDEFTYFAGGHGDIVSMGTLELPILEEETGIDTVTFGRYNGFRSTPAARCDDDYETLEDVPDGSTIGVNSAVSSTILWDVYAREVHGFPFEVGNADTPFELLIEDHFVLPELLVRGELEAAVIIPEAGAPYLRTGELCYMYGGLASWEVLPEILPNPDHKGVLSNGFTVTREFFDEHPEAIQAFLAIWDVGLQQWAEHKDEIVRRYPQHFSVESEEDIAFIVDYLESEHDYFQPTVYLDQEWIDSEVAIYDLMKEHGRMDPDAEIPEFAIVEPPETP
ncbi:MAG: ABC transporter substrate-binding protein [Acidimicrobiales bacterium]